MDIQTPHRAQATALLVLAVGLLAPWNANNPARDIQYAVVQPGSTWGIAHVPVKRELFALLLGLVAVSVLVDSEWFVRCASVLLGAFAVFSLFEYPCHLLGTAGLCLPTAALQPGPDVRYVLVYGYFVALAGAVALVVVNSYLAFEAFSRGQRA